MKKLSIATIALCIAATACTGGKEKYNEGAKTPIRSLPTTYAYYGDDYDTDADGPDFPIEILSDSVDYLSYPVGIEPTPQLDSLVCAYNLVALCQALDADLLTYSRDLAIPSHISPDSLNWITEPELRGLFVALDQAVGNINESPDYSDYTLAMMNVQDFVHERYLDNMFNRADTLVLEKAFEASTYVADIDSLHSMIINQPEEATKIIGKRLLEEEYFIPQAHIAVEYALACYADPDLESGNKTLIPALLEQIMEAGIYSPNLPEIWRMWRVRNQMHHSPSNDGIIYNHHYNKYRNKAAQTCLAQYADTQSSDALINFLNLAIESNIIRYGTFGNSAMSEEMELFWSPTRAEE